MSLRYILVLTLFLPVAGLAQTNPGTGLEPLPASEAVLADFLWQKRPLVVFADTPADPSFVRQMEMLAQMLGQVLAGGNRSSPPQPAMTPWDLGPNSRDAEKILVPTLQPTMDYETWRFQARRSLFRRQRRAAWLRPARCCRTRRR